MEKNFPPNYVGFISIKMKKEGKLHQQSKDSIILKVNYFSSISSLVMGIACLFLLDIYKVIPLVFIAHAIINCCNAILYKKHKNFELSYNINSISSLIGSFIIILFSGGVNSPFIFILAIIVFAAYTTNKFYGKKYLYLILAAVVAIYCLSLLGYDIENVVPETSKSTFSFLSIMYSIYILGAIFGKFLSNTHYNLYQSKKELEKQHKVKEVLLKEIHHRVKNNLQTVSSLLSLQSRNINDEQVKYLMKSSQNRVVSMSIIHEMLYMREDFSKIEYKSYVEELSTYLINSMKGINNKIKLNLDIDDIKLDIDTAIPLGLLINETVSNSLKYGIKDDTEGEINIALKKGTEKDYILNIGDNGVGLAEDISFSNTKTLGLKLMHNLTRQLKGSITQDSTKKGTNYSIKFQEIGQPFPSLN